MDLPIYLGIKRMTALQEYQVSDNAAHEVAGGCRCHHSLMMSSSASHRKQVRIESVTSEKRSTMGMGPFTATL